MGYILWLFIQGIITVIVMVGKVIITVSINHRIMFKHYRSLVISACVIYAVINIHNHLPPISVYTSFIYCLIYDIRYSVSQSRSAENSCYIIAKLLIH